MASSIATLDEPGCATASPEASGVFTIQSVLVDPAAQRRAREQLIRHLSAASALARQAGSPLVYTIEALEAVERARTP